MKFVCETLNEEFCLEEGLHVIGRIKDECDLVLPANAKEVSRIHAEYKLDQHRLQLRDLDSRNHTFLNGIQLKSQVWHEVQHGDEIGIGGYTFVAQDEGSCILDDDSFHQQPKDKSSILISSKAVLGQQGSQHYGQLQALIRVSNVLRGILSSDGVLQETAKILHEIFRNTERAVIGVVDENGSATPRWWHSKRQVSEIRISNTIVQKVTESCEALLSSNAMEQFRDAESVPALSINAVMCAPLFGEQDKVVGFVYIDSCSDTKFNEADLKILAAVATQVSLALGYARMHESAVQKQVYLQDLARARTVQTQYLPSGPPEIPGYEISFFYRAARQIGGDYFDSFTVSPAEHLFVLGDVEGKGAPAALTMVRLASETRAGAEVCSSAASLLNRLGKRMTEKWITFVAVKLDWQSHVARIANAAQELPLLVHSDGKHTELTQETGGLPFSVSPDEEYSEEEVSLNPGDALILYSDGFPDAESENGERFGKQRLFEHFQNSPAPTSNWATALCESIDEYRGKEEQFDDMCLICIQRKG